MWKLSCCRMETENTHSFKFATCVEEKIILLKTARRSKFIMAPTCCKILHKSSNSSCWAGKMQLGVTMEAKLTQRAFLAHFLSVETSIENHETVHLCDFSITTFLAQINSYVCATGCLFVDADLSQLRRFHPVYGMVHSSSALRLEIPAIANCN